MFRLRDFEGNLTLSLYSFNLGLRGEEYSLIMTILRKIRAITYIQIKSELETHFQTMPEDKLQKTLKDLQAARSVEYKDNCYYLTALGITNADLIISLSKAGIRDTTLDEKVRRFFESINVYMKK